MDFRWTFLGVYPFFIFTFFGYLMIRAHIVGHNCKKISISGVKENNTSICFPSPFMTSSNGGDIYILIYKIFSSWAVLIKSFFIHELKKYLLPLPTRSIKQIGDYHISVTIN